MTDDAVSRFAPAAQTARTSASRLIAYSSSQQTAASHAADACAAMSSASPSRPAALWGSTRSRSGTSCDSSPVDERDPIRGQADVARVVGVAMDDACLTSDEPLPRCPTSSNALRRHRAKVISFDIDGLDAANAMGTGVPEVGGYSVRDAQVMLQS